MADFPAIIDPAAPGVFGTVIVGAAALDHAGYAVAAAGDINGDGIDDFVVGAVLADPNGDESGATYVVFGSASGFPAQLDLAAIDGTNGFRINGELAHDYSGAQVSHGDFNGDGISDLLIGAQGADPHGSASGSAYVVFGRNTAVDGAFAATMNLSGLDGVNGFQMAGASSGAKAGRRVESAGDVNGDGVDDILVGAPGSLTAYVVFGKDTGLDGDFASLVELSALDGTNGFRIASSGGGDQLGVAVSTAGDFNGDGVDDLMVGAPGAGGVGAAFIIYGRDTASVGDFSSVVSLATLTATEGLRINGVAASDLAGTSVQVAGDINGDGINDLVISATGADNNGADSGSVYVIYGGAGALGATLALSSLDGTNGFRIDGDAGQGIGFHVSGAGDVNGDGIGDLIIVHRQHSGTATADVLFGRNTALDGDFAASIVLSALGAGAGFRVEGATGSGLIGDQLGSAVGDVNGDGVGDIMFGFPRSGTGGLAVLVYGQSTNDDFLGTAGDDAATGGSGADQLSGLAGKDILDGAGGDDVIDGGSENDVLYGGDGADDLLGGAGRDWLQGDAGDDTLDAGDGADKLFGGLGSDELIGGLDNDRFDGGDGIDALTGGAGNDYLDGGIGADVMTGGTENDVFIVDDAGDQTIEMANQGYDIIRTTLDGWSLGAHIEALELQGTADLDGSGNGLANNLQGNAGANRLSGEAGNDTLNGNDGDDIIIGGLGGDLLRGGTGADTFLVAHVFGAGLETDQIYDFSTAEGDIIDLSGIDAIAGGTDDAFTVVGAFGRQAGQMTLAFAGGITTLKLDVTGDGKVDYQIRINGDVTGDSAGWLL